MNLFSYFVEQCRVITFKVGIIDNQILRSYQRRMITVSILAKLL